MVTLDDGLIHKMTDYKLQPSFLPSKCNLNLKLAFWASNDGKKWFENIFLKSLRAIYVTEFIVLGIYEKKSRLEEFQKCFFGPLFTIIFMPKIVFHFRVKNTIK